MSVTGVKASARHLHRSLRCTSPQCLLALLLVLSLTAAATKGGAWASAQSTRIELLVQGMDCSLCVQGLEQRLKTLPGAEQVKLDLERGRLSLMLRPGSRLADETLRTLMRDAGFVVRQIHRSAVGP
jgi:copper chaperone CopZ